jgi:hypothetical protein
MHQKENDMVSARLSGGVAVLTTLMMFACEIAGAQSLAVQAKIQAAVVQATAAPATSIEIALAAGVLTISRVNSTMKGSTHQGYIDDAEATVLTVVLAVRDEPEAIGITIIRVDYLQRSSSAKHDRILDSVEFRKNSGGVFVLHAS